MSPLLSLMVPQAKIRALRPGTVTIRGGKTDSGLTAACTLVVRDHTFYLDGVYGWAGGTHEAVFYSETDAPAEFTIADESIARIESVGEMGALFDHHQLIRIELLKSGVTTLTAVTPDGRTATADITVTSFTETTAIYYEQTTSSTTTTVTTPAEGVKKGDVNGDDAIDIMDVIRLNKFLLGVDSLSEEQRAAADVDGNDELDATDSLLILKYTVELIDHFDA